MLGWSFTLCITYTRIHGVQSGSETRNNEKEQNCQKRSCADKILISVCKDNGLPGCLAPFVKFNRCSITLTAKDSEAVMDICRTIIEHQQDFTRGHKHTYIKFA